METCRAANVSANWLSPNAWDARFLAQFTRFCLCLWNNYVAVIVDVCGVIDYRAKKNWLEFKTTAPQISRRCRLQPFIEQPKSDIQKYSGNLQHRRETQRFGALA